MARALSSQSSVNSAVKTICDILRRGGCTSALQYIPELTWILFLRILDERETQEASENKAVGRAFAASINAPYRWQDWAAPKAKKREELTSAPQGSLFAFVNEKLLPYLKSLKDHPRATARQKVISEVMNSVEKVRVDTERNFLDVLDKVHELQQESMDSSHVFALSQVYEGLLLKMGEKNNDGGQFFTPRQVIKAVVKAIDPKPGETIYDPGCGTGGFLAEAYEHVINTYGAKATANQLTTLKNKTFFGREKEGLIFPIALANLILHGIDKPNLWWGNTLTGRIDYEGLFEGAPEFFDVILTNPPFGGKEGKEAQTDFAYKTSSTQVLFIQHLLKHMKNKSRCGIVLDEGVLFRANEDAFVKTKQKLLNECDLWCIVSLPGGVFTQAGAGVKTNLLFFTKGQPTRKIWYYDLSDLKIRKKNPMTLDHFEEFFRLLPTRTDSERSWTIDLDARKKKAQEEAAKLDEAKRKDRLNSVYDLKAVNPNRKADVDERTPIELMDLIAAKGDEINAALAELRKLTRPSANHP
ncbi:MAG: N-6 DNA methylase [Flavobacteriales bacterium]|nr:N-6 DNA methylase [Flavobacteriales bacterium]MBK9076524.1 N-6 DNA methylase [Flavobacteriales bacterium]